MYFALATDIILHIKLSFSSVIKETVNVIKVRPSMDRGADPLHHYFVLETI